MKRQVLSAALILVGTASLSACGKSGGDAETSAAPADKAVAAAAEVAFKMEPGLYRTTINVTKAEIPGLPPQLMEKMKESMSKAASTESCITPEHAAKGVEVMKEQMAKGDCQFEKFEASGGTIDSAFTCKSKEGMAMKVASHGTYTPTGSVVDAKAEMTGPGGKTMHIEQTVTTERVGDCKA